MSWNIKEVIEAKCTVQQRKSSDSVLSPAFHRYSVLYTVCCMSHFEDKKLCQHMFTYLLLHS